MNMGLTEAEVKKMTVKQLQDALAKYALDKKGVKADLQARLIEHLQTSASNDVDAGSESGANESSGPKESHSSVEGASNDDSSASEASLKQLAQSPRKSDTPAPTTSTDTVSADSSAPDGQSKSPDGGKRSQDSPSAVGPTKKQKTTPLDAIPDSMIAPTPTIRIDNFIRPFTLNAVKAFVQEEAAFVENGFWMDAIKTHCYVTYATTDAAIAARGRIYGTTWPELSGRRLTVEFSAETAMDIAVKQTTAATSATRRGSNRPSHELPKQQSNKATTDEALTKPPVAAQDLFCKTKAEPALFYLPVDDDLVARRRANLEKKKLGLLPLRRRSGRHRRGGRNNRRGNTRGSNRAAAAQA
ncbi:hypothetical protein H310_11196 [Aphanomyces invadans]|uniref:SAP domain-containing protein n=1 Tax=Aphanomyces invadans TaxID=157072 RepID=A0A024TNU6_9STRA|nr:hypothetical protein H310_11196 [Aphanomyces invadans]ETV95296.1 hypothetical protein H310_11196 [Aphanomyces invadans]|eukprot:XP_008875997.1 hypothetical protein H310_11196 [Aphanomyces invadans]